MVDFVPLTSRPLGPVDEPILPPSLALAILGTDSSWSRKQCIQVIKDDPMNVARTVFPVVRVETKP